MEWNMCDENVHECQFLWDIENFSVCINQNRNFIISPMIVSSLLGDSGWSICFELQGDDDKAFTSIYLRRIKTDEGPTSIDACFEIGLVDNSGQLCHNKSVRDSFLRGDFAGHTKFVERDEIFMFHSRILKKDILTFKGRIWRPSFSGTFCEKKMLRSNLQMELATFVLKMHPARYKSKFEQKTKTVKDLRLHCIYHGIDASTGKPRLPDIRVELMKETSSWIFVSVRMSVLNKNAERLFEETSNHRYVAGSDNYWHLPSINDHLQECHSFDDLKVSLEFTISDGDDENYIDYRFSEAHQGLLKALEHRNRHILARDMAHVVFQDVFPDVYVKLGEEWMIPAHRVVLGARSPVLRKLLVDAKTKWELSLKALRHMVRKADKVSDETEDSEEGQAKLGEAAKRSGAKVSRSGGLFVVEFPEDEGRVINKMMSFMYTDTIRSVDYDTAMKLLEAADTYQVKGLKEWCSSYLKGRITVKNANSMLLAAKYHGCVALENELNLFIYENKEFVDYDMGRQMSAYSNVNNLLRETFV